MRIDHYAAAYYNRGAARQDLNDVIGAVADFSKAVQLEPGYAEAYANRGGFASKVRTYWLSMSSFASLRSLRLRVKPYFRRVREFSRKGAKIAKEFTESRKPAIPDF